jgi:hypothetical protein
MVRTNLPWLSKNFKSAVCKPPKLYLNVPRLSNRNDLLLFFAMTLIPTSDVADSPYHFIDLGAVISAGSAAVVLERLPASAPV